MTILSKQTYPEDGDPDIGSGHVPSKVQYKVQQQRFDGGRWDQLPPVHIHHVADTTNCGDMYHVGWVIQQTLWRNINIVV